MATLNNTRISDTYFGLIKTIDNAVISATLKELSDGSGNATGLSINNAGDFKVNAILEFGSLKDTGENIVISKFVDAADGIGNNNNDTSIPTTKAIIDYVAAQITAEDLDFRGDDGSVLGDVDLNSEAFIILGTANEIQTAVTAAGGNTIQIGLPNNVTITSDLSAVNLNASSLLTTLNMRLKGDISILNKAGSGYAAFAQRDVSGSSALINLNNIGSIGASGTITAPTFSGQLSGTISSATTATTQSAGDNSTKVATTAYVDSLDAGSDLDFSGDSGTGAVVLNTETLAVTGTTNQIETTATGTGLNIKFPTAGVVLPNGSTATTQSSSDNSTKVATTAYVKGLDNASDLDITGDTGTGAVNLNTQTLDFRGTSNQIITTISGKTATFSLPSSINVNSASATILQTARDISLTGEASGTISSFNGSSNVSGAVTLDNNSVTGKVLTGLAAPTATNILASDTILQAFGKAQSQINTLAGGLRFMGTWNATTNSPTLASGGGESASGTTTGTTANKLVDSSASFTNAVDGDRVVNQASGATATVDNVDSSTVLTLSADIMVSGQEYTIDNSPFITQGHYFVVSVGGTSSLNGLSNWAVGDWVIAGANNTWEKLDHTQVDGTGTTGNITKWESTNVIADSIMAESGSTISVTGSLSTSQLLSSGGNFAVNTNKFTANATTGNIVAAGTGTFGGAVRINATTTTGLVISSSSGSSSGLKLYNNSTTDNAYIYNHFDGNLEIGTNNATVLTMNGTSSTFAGTIGSGAITSTGNISGSNLTASVRLFSGDGGNKTNPMIANGSDEDTGIFFPSANVMAFTAGNTEALRFTGGNSTFAGAITVAGAGTFNGDVTINRPVTISPNTVGKNTFEFTTNAANDGRLLMKSVDTVKVDIQANGTSYFNGGKVIVGKDSSNALEVFSSGDTEIGFSYATQGNIYAKIIGDITVASPLGGELAFQTATGGTLAERMRISASGNVGIGQAPSDFADWRVLELKGLTNGSMLNFENSSSVRTGAIAMNDASSLLRLQTMTASGIAFEPNNAEAMRIKPSGSIYSVNTIQGTYFGQDAGNPANVTGVGNTSIGYATGQALTSGANNVLIGRSAAESMTAGASNICIGKEAGKAGDFSESVFIGHLAGQANTQGSTVGIGTEALKANTSVNNTAVGHRVLIANTSGDSNTGLGFRALDTNITGNNNTAIGSESLKNSTGGSNTAVGTQSALDNSSGSGNVAIGTSALRVNTTGSDAVAIGANALKSDTTVEESVAVGANALMNQTSGRNHAFGFRALQDLTTGNYNTAVGGEAAENITDGSSNVAVGAFSLRQNTSGSENTAIGYQSLSNNTTQVKLTALGYRSGYFWTGGNENTFIGYNSGFSSAGGSTGAENTLVGSLAGANSSAITGNGNTSIGRYTLFALTSGAFNTALGHQAGGSLSTGSSNTLVGKNAGDTIGGGSRNTLLGQSAGQAISSGSDNIAIGYESLHSVTTGGSGTIAIGVNSLYSYTGSRVVAIGYGAGQSLVSDVDNVFIGQEAGKLRTTGIDNTAVGAYSQYGGTSGSPPQGCCNTSVGRATLYSISVGVQNTAIGRQAGYAITNGNNNTLVGHNTALSMVGGYDNTCIGSAAGDILTTGSNNTCIGYDSDTPSNSSTNTVVLGNTAISSLRCQVQTISALSDERDKTNIKDSEYGLNIIDSLRPVTFDWKQRDGHRDGLKDLGFIAQDLQKVDDKNLNLVDDEDPEKLVAAYGRLIPVLVKSIQELKAEVDLLKKQCNCK